LGKVNTAAAATAARPEPVWLQTLAGGVSGCVARAVVTPLDVVKIRVQLKVENVGKYRSAWHCAATSAREEGLQALWRGHVASQALAVSYSAVQVRKALISTHFLNSLGWE
jgi:solute carrier family 25 thiamine pyrophosphate transporter 19